MGRSAVKINQRLTSSQQWGILVAAVMLLTGLTLTWLVSSHLLQQLENQQKSLAELLIRDTSVLLRPTLNQDDRISANIMLQDWVDQELILAATLYDADQRPIAEQGLIDVSGLNMLWVDQPVTDDNQLIGHLRVAVNLQQAHNLSRKNAALLTMATLLLAILSGLLAYFWAERQTRLQRKQISALEQLNNGEELQLLDEKSLSADADLMTSTINDVLRHKIEKRSVRNALQRFMTPAPMAQHKPLTYHNSAILFIEIQGLEELQKRLSADELVSALNRYHRLLSQAAKLYNGTLDRYIGDGVMMIFGYPQADPRDPGHCLYAAQLFAGLVNELRRTDPHLQPLDFKLAAHWGPVLIAPLSMTSGEQDNIQFNLIGDTLHWAAQLAQNSDQQQLLVSQTLIQQLEESGTMTWREGPLLPDLNGSEQSTYWLDSLPDTARLLIDRQVKHITAMKEEA